MIRIAHVITGLRTGGAELMLERLIPGLSHQGFSNIVVSLTPGGEVAERMRRDGVDVTSLDFPRAPAASLLGLSAAVRRFRPALVQTWMYHADLLAGLTARVAHRSKVIWNLRTTAPADLPDHQRLIRVCAVLSRGLPAAIVACSNAAVRAHGAFGYATAKMRVIHNGFDTEKLRPDATARREVRAELGIGPTVPLVGLVARFDPLKDHETFVSAAGVIARENADARFLLCGDNVVSANSELMAWIKLAKIEERTYLLGRREDVPRVNAALDIAVCSSSMEGMPNVVGEAMSCGVPCIVTDVGDAALLVGDTGAVVPRRDPNALASACLTWLALPADELRRRGERARSRILEEFSLPVSVKRYAELYRSVVAL